MTQGAADLAQLRSLLLGQDYEFLLALKSQFSTPDQYSASVATVIAEALLIRNSTDQAVAQALAPTIEQALTESIYQQPNRFAEVLYPVMGPAIRKSIQQSLAEAVETFNQLLEQSVSLRSWRWRFYAWRTGQSYAQIVMLHTLVYQVEQVFLIHRETGLLIHHLTAAQASSKDPDLVSGMLTAIQDFIADSFTLKQTDTLRTLKLGDLSVLIEHGPFAVMALVVRGTVPAELHHILLETSAAIHRHYTPALKSYAGNSESLSGLETLLSRCLLSQQQMPVKRQPWLVYGFIALVAGLSAYAWYNYATRQQLFMQALQQLQAEPGIIVLASSTTDQGYQFKGLVDPLARTPAQVLSDPIQQETTLSFDFRPYLSMDPPILLLRAKQMLNPPAQVELQLKDLVLHMSGNATQAWLQEVHKLAPFVNGLKGIDTQQVHVSDPVQDELNRLSQLLSTSKFLFEAGKADTAALMPALVKSAQTIKALHKLAGQTNQSLKVYIAGHTDHSGSEAFNLQLAAQRAQAIRQALLTAGTPSTLIVVEDNALSDKQNKNNERSATYRLELY